MRTKDIENTQVKLKREREKFEKWMDTQLDYQKIMEEVDDGKQNTL